MMRKMADYLYNGWGPIPDIYAVYTPELQKKFPYASLSLDAWGSSNNYYLNAAYLHLSTIPLYQAGNLAGLFPRTRAYPKEDGTSICYVAEYSGYRLKPFVRLEEEDATLTAGKIADFNLDWANYDVRYAETDALVYAASEPAPVPYLTFVSADSFTIAVRNATKNWDGILEYSTDLQTWTEWDGTAAIASASTIDGQRIYMRGTGNTVITGYSYNIAMYTTDYTWVLTGENIHCIGNIENLLDYKTVANGEHPTMSSWCFGTLFYGCASLVSAPELPAMELKARCYAAMFYNCTGLTVPPELPAVTMLQGCYASMFFGCTGLTTVPALPATTVAVQCYFEMFRGCTGLTTVPALPATTLVQECYSRMFRNCTGLKFSGTQSEEYPNAYRIPSSGEGVEENPYWKYYMLYGTGGESIHSPSINTTYYTANEVIYPDAPVTPPPIDPTSLLMGWLVGKRIAAQRGK